MYKVLEVKDKVRVPPIKFSLPALDAVKSSLEDKWEGLVDKNLGIILAVLSVDDVGEGRILPEDGAIHYPTAFKIMVYRPDLHEVVKGEIIDVTEFGAFIRIGPIDGMIHVSQLMNDFVSYDAKNRIFSGKDSKRKLKEKDVMLSRIISVSMERNQYKLGLTARQAGLGVLEWIQEDKKRGKKKAAGVAAKPEPKKPVGKKGNN